MKFVRCRFDSFYDIQGEEKHYVFDIGDVVDFPKGMAKELKRTKIVTFVDGEKEPVTHITPPEFLKAKTKSQLLLDIADESLEIIRDQFDESYAIITVGQHKELHPLKSRWFRSWLAKEYNEKYDDTVSDSSINQVITTLSGRALFDSPKVKLDVRVAQRAGKIYYDLCSPSWEVIEVDSEGWRVITPPEQMFKRFPHMLEQVRPITGGDPKRLLDYFNVKGDSDGAKILLLVYIVSDFFPEIPHPVLNIHGSHGSAKSTGLKVIRKVVDPSALELLAIPKDEVELIQKMSHHWICFFDNITRLSSNTSDNFCRAVTGEGFSKRMLYTDDDDIFYKYQRCVGLNGINIPAQKSDLLDRSILQEFERIPEHLRRDEAEFYAELKADMPEILGGIFDAISHALKIRGEIKLSEKPRMADFTLIGEAISLSLGYSEGAFVEAYKLNLKEQNAEALEAHIIGRPILTFLEGREGWQGSASALLSELETVADTLHINRHEGQWPRGPNVVRRRLVDIKANLLDAGWQVAYSRKGPSGEKIITLSKAGKISSLSSDRQGQRSLTDDTYEIPSEIPSADLDAKTLIDDKTDDTDGSDDKSPLPLSADPVIFLPELRDRSIIAENDPLFQRPEFGAMVPSAWVKQLVHRGWLEPSPDGYSYRVRHDRLMPGGVQL